LEQERASLICYNLGNRWQFPNVWNRPSCPTVITRGQTELLQCPGHVARAWPRDFTCPDTLAASHLNVAVTGLGQVAYHAERASPAQLWRSVDALMDRGRLPMTDAIEPNDLHAFFDAKVAVVQAATVDALPPTFTPVTSGSSFSQFRSFAVSICRHR